jgi:hypothetical protein
MAWVSGQHTSDVLGHVLEYRCGATQPLAVHLFEAGVEINVIRARLRHVSLETTKCYAEITLCTKNAAGRSSEKRGIPRKPIWQSDTALLTWRQSL